MSSGECQSREPFCPSGAILAALTALPRRADQIPDSGVALSLGPFRMFQFLHPEGLHG